MYLLQFKGRALDLVETILLHCQDVNSSPYILFDIANRLNPH